MSSAEDEVELQERLVEVLERNGTLAKIRAQLRASVFLAFEERINASDKGSKGDAFYGNKVARDFMQAEEKQLCAQLIQDFMISLNLSSSLTVFEPEIGLQSASAPSRSDLASRLNLTQLAAANSESPLLYLLVKQQLLGTNDATKVGVEPDKVAVNGDGHAKTAHKGVYIPALNLDGASQISPIEQQPEAKGKALETQQKAHTSLLEMSRHSELISSAGSIGNASFSSAVSDFDKLEQLEPVTAIKKTSSSGLTKQSSDSEIAEMFQQKESFLFGRKTALSESQPAAGFDSLFGGLQQPAAKSSFPSLTGFGFPSLGGSKGGDSLSKDKQKLKLPADLLFENDAGTISDGDSTPEDSVGNSRSSSQSGKEGLLPQVTSSLLTGGGSKLRQPSPSSRATEKENSAAGVVAGGKKGSNVAAPPPANKMVQQATAAAKNNGKEPAKVGRTESTDEDISEDIPEDIEVEEMSEHSAISF